MAWTCQFFPPSLLLSRAEILGYLLAAFCIAIHVPEVLLYLWYYCQVRRTALVARISIHRERDLVETWTGNGVILRKIFSFLVS